MTSRGFFQRFMPGHTKEKEMERLRKQYERDMEMDRKVTKIGENVRKDEIPVLDESFFYP